MILDYQLTLDPLTITVHALPKQMQFLRSPAREVLLSGGYGCGKSMSLAIKLASRAVVPGTREILARKTFASLGRSTLATLLEGDGKMPPILPAGSYRHHKVDHLISIKGGGQIYYVGCDDPLKLGSINATGVAVDEAAELEHDDLVMLRGRCRSQVDGLTPQIYMATNPRGPLHPLAKRFGLNGIDQPHPGCEAITMSSDENPNLPDTYVKDLASLTGADRAKFFEGRWVSADGLVYSQFDHNRMVMHREGPWAQVVIGQDAGFNDPDVLLVVCKDAAGRIHVADEFCKSGQLVDAVIAAAKKMKALHRVECFYIDPSAARLRVTMEQEGLNMRNADNAILDGVRTVQRHMVTDGQGVPSFTVEPHCEHTIRELGSYAWTPGKDKPRDSFNHCMDALRYAVAGLSVAAPSYEVRSLGDDDDEDDEASERAYNGKKMGKRQPYYTKLFRSAIVFSAAAGKMLSSAECSAGESLWGCGIQFRWIRPTFLHHHF